MIFHTLFDLETIEQEKERLGKSPEGSINHHLSTLPIHNDIWITKGMTFIVSDTFKDSKLITIATVQEIDENATTTDSGRRILKDQSYNCIIVYTNDNTMNKVGGYNIIVSEEQLRRSRRVNFESIL